MSTGWIWAIWTVLMLAWAYVTLIYDLGPNEFALFMIVALALSVGAALYRPAPQRG
jgi:hypothetical protein